MNSSVPHTLRSQSCIKTSMPSFSTSSLTASGVRGHLRSQIRRGSSRRMPIVSLAAFRAVAWYRRDDERLEMKEKEIGERRKMGIAVVRSTVSS